MLQRKIAKLDENGNQAGTVKDKVHAADRRKKMYENKIREYRDKLEDLE